MVDSTRKIKLSTMRNFAVMLTEQLLYNVHEFLILQESYSWKQCYTPFQFTTVVSRIDACLNSLRRL